jgi:O-antigen/teichoic acid export membrane protein
MVPFGLLVLGASALLGARVPLETRAAMAALGLAGPAILLMWLYRRAFYVILKPEWALLGAGSYFVLLVGAAAVLRLTARVTPAAAFGAMGGSALLVSLLLALRLRPLWAAGEPSAASAAREHWRYARWAVASAGLTWIPANLYFALLPVWAGLEGNAALRALTNLVMPPMHALSALSLLLVPILVRQGGAKTRPVVGRLLPAFAAGGGLYYTTLVVFRREIMTLLYGGRYSEVVPLVPLIGLFAFLAGPLSLLGAALRAQERPDKVFWSYLAASAAALGSGVPLAARFGVPGALAGLLFSSLTAASAMFLLYHARLPRRSP